jgi:hypothetical protein
VANILCAYTLDLMSNPLLRPFHKLHYYKGLNLFKVSLNFERSFSFSTKFFSTNHLFIIKTSYMDIFILHNPPFPLIWLNSCLTMIIYQRNFTFISAKAHFIITISAKFKIYSRTEKRSLTPEGGSSLHTLCSIR